MPNTSLDEAIEALEKIEARMTDTQTIDTVSKEIRQQILLAEKVEELKERRPERRIPVHSWVWVDKQIKGIIEGYGYDRVRISIKGLLFEISLRQMRFHITRVKVKNADIERNLRTSVPIAH